MVLYANPNSTNAGIYGLTTIGRNSYIDDESADNYKKCKER